MYVKIYWWPKYQKAKSHGQNFESKVCSSSWFIIPSEANKHWRIADSKCVEHVMLNDNIQEQDHTNYTQWIDCLNKVEKIDKSIKEVCESCMYQN